MTRRQFVISLGAIATASLVFRLGYVLWQVAHDPGSVRPGLDSAMYVEWARALQGGALEPTGAFYLAPLFPHLLAGFFALFGESWRLLYATQELMVVGASVFLALGAVARIGAAGALLAASIALLYHPVAFFAARSVGEPVALVLLALGIYLASRLTTGFAASAGLAFGLATLARPNLLLVPAGFALVDAASRKWTRALVLTAVVAAVLAPVAARNYAASGHPVLVSSNGGMTLYHGNGPGALGIFTPAEGFSGALSHQRDEATILARARSGKPLDAVDADRWWGRQALHTRARDPMGTIALIARRVVLTLDNYEHGLDDAPALDGNPWRRAFPVPLAAILGLAATGVAALGFRGTGGATAWVPIAAGAATPVAFYVSSRYRLPMAFFLCVPAGAGAAIVLDALRARRRDGRTIKALTAGALVALISILVPSGPLALSEESAAHANRAFVFTEARDLPRAEAEARTALALDPSSVMGRFHLAVTLTAAGRSPEAEALYREALSLDPSHAESAGNLAKILVERGAAAEAVPILERALASRPGDQNCWTNLVVAFLSMNDPSRARRALADGERAGVRFEPELVDAVGAGRP